jgi:hypothetical protein
MEYLYIREEFLTLKQSSTDFRAPPISNGWIISSGTLLVQVKLVVSNVYPQTACDL